MGSRIDAEISRVREMYKNRDTNVHPPDWKGNIYHPRHPMGRLFFEHNFNILVDALNALDLHVEDASVLDVGCGTGGWLRRFVELGAKPENLTGLDLSENRIKLARTSNPAINWVQSDGSGIPLPSARFDIVMQVVVFSSILDEGLAETLLREMHRVTKPGGYIFWVDHKKSHSESLSGYSIEKLSGYLSDCSLVYQESVHPGYIRKWFNHPWLCRLLYDFTKKDCDSYFLVFQKTRNAISD